MIQSIAHKLAVTLLPQTMELKNAKKFSKTEEGYFGSHGLSNHAGASPKQALAFDIATLVPRVVIGSAHPSVISAGAFDALEGPRRSELGTKPFCGIYKWTTSMLKKMVMCSGMIVGAAVFLGVSALALLPKALCAPLGIKFKSSNVGEKAADKTVYAIGLCYEKIESALEKPIDWADLAIETFNKRLYGVITEMDDFSTVGDSDIAFM